MLAICAFPSLALAQPSTYLGVETCGACHLRALEAWRSGPHARAAQSLTGRQADDPMCLTCHSLVGSPSSSIPAVECESCHGAGRHYSADHVMRDPVLAELLGLEPIREATCAGCHRPHAPSAVRFDFESALRRVCVNRAPPVSPSPEAP